MSIGIGWLRVHCPYCGECFETAVDASGRDADYVEDCAVCCRPIALSIAIDENGEVACRTRRDDETG